MITREAQLPAASVPLVKYVRADAMLLRVIDFRVRRHTGLMPLRHAVDCCYATMLMPHAII